MTFIAVVSVAGALQGLVLLVALRRIKHRHRLANKVLSVFVGLVVATLLVRVIRAEGGAVRDLYPQMLLLMDTPVYAYGPLLFLYLYSLTTAAEPLPRLWGLHFIPVSLHLLRQMEYWLESPAAFVARLQTGDFPFWRFVLMGAIVQMGIYIGICTWMVLRSRGQEEHGRSAHAGYMKTILVLVAMAWAAWGYHALSVLTDWVPRAGYVVADLAWIVMSLIPMVLAYFAIGRQEVFRMIPIARKYQGSTLSDEEVSELQHRLVALMVSEKPYLEPDINVAALAERVNCSPKQLSRVINERFGQNFFDFVNGYRVEEFKRLATKAQNRHHSVLAIAYEAGFNSKSTFYAAFRKISTESPGDYVRSVQRAATA